MVKTNSQSYAIALFSIAKDKNEQELFYNQAKTLADVNNECSSFSNLLANRSLSKNERKQAVYEILKELEFNKTFIYWVWTIIDCNKYAYYDEIMREVTKQYLYLFDIEPIEIASASDLSDAQVARLKEFFTTKLNKKVNLTIKVNPAYIGGLKIKIRNKIYDNTFIDQLKQLKNKILNDREGK